jgi:hypothetical protein
VAIAAESEEDIKKANAFCKKFSRMKNPDETFRRHSVISGRELERFG